MKLLVVTHYFSTHRGGIEIIAHRVAGLLARTYGVEVTWAASDVDPPPPPESGLAYLPMRASNGLENRLGVPYPLWSPGALRRLRAAVREHDVVHIHDFPYMGNLAAFRYARGLGKPVLLTQHIGPVPYRSAILRAVYGAALATAGRFVLRRADRVVCYSTAVRDFFHARGAFAREPVMIPNGIDTALFHPVDDARRAAARAELGLDADGPVCLFVGRFVEKKGLHVLEQLARRLPAVQWVFAGWGPLDPGAWALPNVTVFRDKTNADLPALYQAADVVVLPSVGEGFPLVIQEALACGTPAMVNTDVARAVPGGAEVMVHDTVGGPDVAERWAARLDSLLHDAATLRAMRARVAAFARAEWSWDACAAAYHAVLTELAGDARA